MGTGKTLSIIEALEAVQPRLAWYVAPRFAIGSIEIMFRNWNAKRIPTFFSYDGDQKVTQNWVPGQKAPDFVVFDESPYLKTPNSQRTLCAKHLAYGVYQDNLIHFIHWYVRRTGTKESKGLVGAV